MTLSKRVHRLETNQGAITESDCLHVDLARKGLINSGQATSTCLPWELLHGILIPPGCQPTGPRQVGFHQPIVCGRPKELPVSRVFPSGFGLVARGLNSDHRSIVQPVEPSHQFVGKGCPREKWEIHECLAHSGCGGDNQ